MSARNLPLAGTPTETQELRYRLNNRVYGIYELGGGCLAWRTAEPKQTVLLYDPEKVVVEFFVGGGSTLYTSDTEHVPRIVIDSSFSKVQMKRAHLSPYFSDRYAIEWHGRNEPMEVPFPMYMDRMCVVATIRPDGSVEMRLDGSIVPQLERVSDISDIVFVKSASKPSDDTGLVAFLSNMVGKENLAALVNGMSGAYDLRMERGREVPYNPINLFSNGF